MPVKVCQMNNRPGFKWGDRGKCYTYTSGNAPSRGRARAKAAKQGRAIKARGGR